MTQPSFADLLLPWFQANRRDLPWRSATPNPYGVWISEVMLQQTTVAAVIPFYNRWMSRFPTVAVLAESPLDEVLRYWAGLGYYARARNLHRAAQAIVLGHNCQVPNSVETLLTLPGIGQYTAGAVCSIAYNLETPILDANVTRVLCRVHQLEGDPKTSASLRSQLWRLAAEGIPPGKASLYNQALMELGALVCSPTDPSCATCPVKGRCLAYAAGSPAEYPQFVGAKTWRQAEHVAVAIRDGSGQFVLTQRDPNDPLWGGLWELPRVVREPKETLAACAIRAAREIVGMDVEFDEPFGTVKHVVANRKITLTGFQTNVEAEGVPVCKGCVRVEWADSESIAAYALATPQRRLIKLLAACS